MKASIIRQMLYVMGMISHTGGAEPKPTGRRRPGWHSPQRMERAAARRERKAAFRQRQYDGSLQR